MIIDILGSMVSWHSFVLTHVFFLLLVLLGLGRHR